MLHKLKPVPRALVIIGIVAIIGYGLTTVDFSKFKKAEPAVTAETVAPPPVTTVAPPSALETANTAVQAATQAAAQAPAPAPAPPAAPSGLTPATNDAGLDAVLRATK